MNMYGYELVRESDLMHHGILGMKWGIRRYQNPDGSLTAAGKRRLNSGKRIKNLDQKAYRKFSIEEDRKNKHNVFVSKVARELAGSANAESGYVKSAIHNSVYNDKKLFTIVDKAARLDNDLEYACADWSKNKDLVHKTTKDYIKSIGKEAYKRFFVDSDAEEAGAYVWAFYVKNTPSLKNKSDEIEKLKLDFEKESEQYYKQFFGDLGNKKDKFGYTLPVGMAIAARETFMDLVLDQAEHIWRTE